MMWPPRPPAPHLRGRKGAPSVASFAGYVAERLRGVLREAPASPPGAASLDRVAGSGLDRGAAPAVLYGPAGFRSAVPGAGSARRRRRRLYEARLAACLLAAGLCGGAPTGEGGRLTRRSRRPSARRVYAGPRGTAREPRRPGESARAENKNAPTAAPHYADAFGPTGPAGRFPDEFAEIFFMTLYAQTVHDSAVHAMAWR